MRPSTITNLTFKAWKLNSGTPIAATASYDAPNRSAVLDPAADLERGATYKVLLDDGSQGPRDVAGNALDQGKVWVFTVSP